MTSLILRAFVKLRILLTATMTLLDYAFRLTQIEAGEASGCKSDLHNCNVQDDKNVLNN